MNIGGLGGRGLGVLLAGAAVRKDSGGRGRVGKLSAALRSLGRFCECCVHGRVDRPLSFAVCRACPICQMNKADRSNLVMLPLGSQRSAKKSTCSLGLEQDRTNTCA